MTSLLDTLEGRGLVERLAHPTDRCKVLVRLTDEAQEVVDRMLPTVQALADLTERERGQLITSPAVVRARLTSMLGQPPPTPKPRHKRR